MPLQSNLPLHELAQAIVESSFDAIITKDLSGTITSWNRSAELIFGYVADEVVGKNITILFPPERIKEEAEIISRIGRGERVEHFETERRRKDGTVFPVSLTVSPIKSDDGVIVGASKIARDISTQKEYERQLVSQAKELEQFAYVASHDLREPLRKVAVYSELLVTRIGSAANPDTTKYAAFITDAVSRMQKLITDLLDYSRSSRSDLNPEDIDLKKVVHGVINDLEVAIHETRAAIEIDSLPWVHANPFEVHQLFQNLLSNAIKFRFADRQPRIRISATDDGKGVTVSVQDNGIGIEPKYHDRVFAIFQRLHSGDKYPGTGIGLAVCKKIIERHGGKIWLNSEIGKGTTVSFTVPSRKSSIEEKRQ